MDRRLDDCDIVAIIIDGKRFKDDEMIIALGVTAEGKNVLLGFIQAGTENASVCKEFLNGLLERGLTIEEGVLCVMGGSKGIRRAVEEVLVSSKTLSLFPSIMPFLIWSRLTILIAPFFYFRI